MGRYLDALEAKQVFKDETQLPKLTPPPRSANWADVVGDVAGVANKVLTPSPLGDLAAIGLNKLFGDDPAVMAAAVKAKQAEAAGGDFGPGGSGWRTPEVTRSAETQNYSGNANTYGEPGMSSLGRHERLGLPALLAPPTDTQEHLKRLVTAESLSRGRRTTGSPAEDFSAGGYGWRIPDKVPQISAPIGDYPIGVDTAHPGDMPMEPGAPERTYTFPTMDIQGDKPAPTPMQAAVKARMEADSTGPEAPVDLSTVGTPFARAEAERLRPEVERARQAEEARRLGPLEDVSAPQSVMAPGPAQPRAPQPPPPSLGGPAVESARTEAATRSAEIARGAATQPPPTVVETPTDAVPDQSTEFSRSVDQQRQAIADRMNAQRGQGPVVPPVGEQRYSMQQVQEFARQAQTPEERQAVLAHAARAVGVQPTSLMDLITGAHKDRFQQEIGHTLPAVDKSKDMLQQAQAMESLGKAKYYDAEAQARIGVKDATAALTRMKALETERGMPSKESYTWAKTSLAMAEQELKLAQVRKALAKKGTGPGGARIKDLIKLEMEGASKAATAEESGKRAIEEAEKAARGLPGLEAESTAAKARVQELDATAKRYEQAEAEAQRRARLSASDEGKRRAAEDEARSARAKVLQAKSQIDRAAEEARKKDAEAGRVRDAAVELPEQRKRLQDATSLRDRHQRSVRLLSTGQARAYLKEHGEDLVTPRKVVPKGTKAPAPAAKTQTAPTVATPDNL